MLNKLKQNTLVQKGKLIFLKFWKIFYPFYKKIISDNIFAIAGQSAFFLVLSVVPLAMFAVSILQGLRIPEYMIEDAVAPVLTEDASKWFAGYMTNMYDSASVISVISIFFTLWSAAQGIHAITNGLNRIYHTYENRNWFMLRFRAMLYTIVFFVIVFATALLVVFGKSINSVVSPHIEHQFFLVSYLYYARYIIVFIYLVVLFALVFRNLPNLSKVNRRRYGVRCQLPGALFCAVSWVVLAWAIGIYVDDFNGYSIYGGLARVAVFLVWLYFCMVCLMIGAEFNFYFHDSIDEFTGKIFKRGKKRVKKENNIDNSK